MGGGGGRTTFGFYFDGFPLDILCHIASALEAMAFLSVDFYYLRLFEISAMFLMAIYNIVVSKNFMDCHFIWALIHLSIHSYRIWEILKKRMASKLSDEDKSLYDGEFDIFSKAEFQVIRQKFEWVTLRKGFVLCSLGKKNQYLYYITEGFLNLENKDGDVFGSPQAPTWIGEIGVFNKSAIASCTVVVGSDHIRAIRFKMDETRKGIHKHGHDLQAHTYHKLPQLFIHNVIKTVDRLSGDVQTERRASRSLSRKNLEMEEKLVRASSTGNNSPQNSPGSSYLVSINEHNNDNNTNGMELTEK